MEQCHDRIPMDHRWKEKLKQILMFISNPHLLLCFAIAWIITNGWAYIGLALGTYFQISWMKTLASGYLALLWLPMTPEKIVTVAIAIALLRLLFPKDKKTLAVLKELLQKAKAALKKNKEKRNDKKKII